MSKRGFLNSSNPFLSENAIEKKSSQILDNDLSDDLFIGMTAQGATNKSIILGLILVLFSFIGYSMGNTTILIACALLGLGTAIFAMVKPKYSPILAPLYAIFEGLFVGGVTLNYSMMFEGIVGNAIILTMALFFAMLFLYKAKIITVTQKFRSVIIMATMGIAVLYLFTFALGFFNINMPFIHETGLMGIGISVVFVAIASLNLLLDFDNFDKGEQRNLPSYMEWFFAMGLIITIVWLYIEVLRLLSKLNRD